MAINMMSENGKIKYGIYEFVVDTLSEIQSLPKDAKPGSSALVLENSSVYMLNGNHEWREL